MASLQKISTSRKVYLIENFYQHLVSPTRSQTFNPSRTFCIYLYHLLTPLLSTNHTPPTHSIMSACQSRNQAVEIATKSGLTSHICACKTRGINGKCGCDCHGELRELALATKSILTTINAPSFFDIVLNRGNQADSDHESSDRAGSPDWAFEYQPRMLGRMGLRIGDAELDVLSALGVPPRPGRLKGGVPSSQFAIWLILLRVPGGKMSLDTIYKTLLEWLPAMKPKNQTVRASLSPSRQAGFLDSPVFVNIRGDGWKLRRLSMSITS